MDKFLNKITRAIDTVGNSAGSFTPEVWTVFALVAVIGGYFLLRGNVLQR